MNLISINNLFDKNGQENSFMQIVIFSPCHSEDTSQLAAGFPDYPLPPEAVAKVIFAESKVL